MKSEVIRDECVRIRWATKGGTLLNNGEKNEAMGNVVSNFCISAFVGIGLIMFLFFWPKRIYILRVCFAEQSLIAL